MPDVLKHDPRPVAPLAPDKDDCCKSGCNPCIFELYSEALERHLTALAAWEARQMQHIKQTSRNK